MPGRRGAFPVAWCGVDAGIMQGEVVAAQGQVDAHADVAAQAAHAVVPPAVLHGVGVQVAVGVAVAEGEDVGKRLSFRRRAEDFVAPGVRIVYVEVSRGDVEVADCFAVRDVEVEDAHVADGRCNRPRLISLG